jgi:putative SOS response-associated peptidase YedK
MHDRMPVIVPADKYEVWLDPDVTNFDAIKDILKPYDATQMRRYPVSTKMNNSKNEGAESAAPVTLDTAVEPRLFENK